MRSVRVAIAALPNLARLRQRYAQRSLLKNETDRGGKVMVNE